MLKAVLIHAKRLSRQNPLLWSLVSSSTVMSVESIPPYFCGTNVRLCKGGTKNLHNQYFLLVQYFIFKINFCNVYTLIYSLIWFYVLCISTQ